VALGLPGRGRSTDRGCSRHDSGVEPDEGAESERAVAHADEAEVRRGEEQTAGGAAAESRPAELPGEPSEAKGCRGGARAVRSQSSKTGQGAEAVRAGRRARGRRWRRGNGGRCIAWPRDSSWGSRGPTVTR
jgi:hypothetical protein